MTNIKYLEQSLPVAPLKIAALESCKGLGEKVNNHIVNFRKEAQTEILNSPLFANYHSDNFHVLEAARLKVISANPSVVLICS